MTPKLPLPAAALSVARFGDNLATLNTSYIKESFYALLKSKNYNHSTPIHHIQISNNVHYEHSPKGLHNLGTLSSFITLHPGQVEAGQITCSYHFNRVGAVEDRASCQYKDSVDYSCDPYSCATQENRGFESLYYRGCHGPQPIGDRQSIHAAQYFLRDDHAAVQDWDGLWWDCPYNIPDSTNKQYLSKSRLSRNQPSN
ncbi:hypothetical protein H4Q26_007385 [Puccinia striiformis f. sp. tritici PST-130]|nr:hypothetical protein H4Q26_007385 [Puccinia striiformis f. sp. tritici PST-130]